MQKLGDAIKQDMNKDYSYLFNKDKIYSFQFELKHDVKGGIKYRKQQGIEVGSNITFFILLGIMFYLLQIYGNKVHIFFVPLAYCMGALGLTGILICYVFQYATIHKATEYLLSLLQQGINQQYLTNDQSKYPYFMQIAFNGSTQNTGKLCASGADKEAKCNMPIWGLVALFNCVKQYQAKYCPVIQTKQDNSQAN